MVMAQSIDATKPKKEVMLKKAMMAAMIAMASSFRPSVLLFIVSSCGDGFPDGWITIWNLAGFDVTGITPP
jgi:hypothetical protein